MTLRAFRVAALALALVVPSAATLRAQTVPGEIAGHKIHVPGEKVDGTTQKLSEVEAEIVARLPPQSQAERLLQYAISHHIGATDEIKLSVKSWRGNIKRSDALATLMDVAINGSDLRPRSRSSWPPSTSRRPGNRWISARADRGRAKRQPASDLAPGHSRESRGRGRPDPSRAPDADAISGRGGCFYPVFPPDTDAGRIVNHLRAEIGPG